jgi:hypothetical protein
LLAVGVALAMLVPKARALGMNVPGWCLLVVATGSIGLLAMLARVSFLSSRAPA